MAIKPKSKKLRKTVKVKWKARTAAKPDKKRPQYKRRPKKRKTPQKKSKLPKSTDSTVKKKGLFIGQFEAAGCNISACCKAINIDRKTYYNWLKNDPEFSTQCSDCEEELIDLAESQLFKNITTGNVTSLIFFLCNKGKHRGWQSVSQIVQRFYGAAPGERFRNLSNKDLVGQIQRLSKKLGVKVDENRLSRTVRSPRGARKKKGKKKPR